MDYAPIPEDAHKALRLRVEAGLREANPDAAPMPPEAPVTSARRSRPDGSPATRRGPGAGSETAISPRSIRPAEMGSLGHAGHDTRRVRGTCRVSSATP